MTLFCKKRTHGRANNLEQS